MDEFRKLGMSDALLAAVKELGFSVPSEIQRKAVPVALSGRDLIGGSATGSGKTLAFGAALVDRLKPGAGLQSLVLVPTRELAEQVAKSLSVFSRFAGLRVIPVFGGVSIEPQISGIRRSDVVVGTPGRILDHLERGTVSFSHLSILVLDEADRMLDMGFINDVERIIRSCPSSRQTMLFSATITEDIRGLASRYMRSPVNVSAEAYVDPSKLKQVYYDVPQGIKFSLLVYLLRSERSGLVMVFCNTRRSADFVGRNLKGAGVDAVTIHGGLTQSRRNDVLGRFHRKQAVVLVCTDVAARGLDIPGVSHVYNYDIPKTSKEYVHRIGRAARAGRSGFAVSLLSERDYDGFSSVLQDRTLRIAKMPVPSVARVRVSFLQDSSYRGYRGHRGGFAPRRHVRR